MNKSLIGRSLCALVLITCAVAALRCVPAHAAPPRARTLTPIEALSAGTFPRVYVVGTTGCLGPSCLRLVSTTIGGHGDTLAALPPLERSRYGLGGTTLQSLSFANGGQGYALVGPPSSMSLYVTHDAATTWQKVSAMPGLTFERITVTDRVVYATMAKCAGADEHCVDVTIAKSALWPIHWTALELPNSPNDALHAGDFAVSANNTTLWLSRVDNNAEVIWRSTNEGATFHETTEPRLVSINGCSFEIVEPNYAWAQCPTGMLVSFYYSHDAGAQWTSVPQRPYAGTGGGFFAPAGNSVAVIDYGQSAHNVYRVDMNDDAATDVGELNCDATNTPVFAAGGSGLVVCTTEAGSTSSSSLYSTSDEGALWHRARLQT